MAENVFYHHEGEGKKVKITVGKELLFSGDNSEAVERAKMTVVQHCQPVLPGECMFLPIVLTGEVFNPFKLDHWRKMSLHGEWFTSEDLLEMPEQERLRVRAEFRRKFLDQQEALGEYCDSNPDPNNIGGWREVWLNMPSEDRQMLLPYVNGEKRVEMIEGLFDG